MLYLAVSRSPLRVDFSTRLRVKMLPFLRLLRRSVRYSEAFVYGFRDVVEGWARRHGFDWELVKPCLYLRRDFS